MGQGCGAGDREQREIQSTGRQVWNKQRTDKGSVVYEPRDCEQHAPIRSGKVVLARVPLQSVTPQQHVSDYTRRMDEDPLAWHVDLNQALTVVVEVDPASNSATLTFESADGRLDGYVLEFEDFPATDFYASGLNIIGPWLNRHGLAYNTWLEPDTGRYTAVVYRYEGPDVDPRDYARRPDR